MRIGLLWLLVGCGFQLEAPPGAPPPDVPPDVPIVPITWTVDGTSAKACPSSASEWSALIAAKNLNIAVPSGLWLAQEGSGSLADSIGPVTLAPYGPPNPTYQQAITGWTRRAVATVDGSISGFANSIAPALPELSATSMTVLAYFASPTTPASPRSFMYGGFGSTLNYANVGIDQNHHLSLTVTPSSATGTVDHGTGVFPVVMKLDRTNLVQTLITDRETITAPYQARSARGITLGGANPGSPDARWLYVAAWYGPSAEISNADLTALIRALGW